MNDSSNNSDEKKCDYCGSDKTHTAVTNGGISYPKWIRNPYKKGTWICWKCRRNYMYLKTHPPIYSRRRDLKKELK